MEIPLLFLLTVSAFCAVLLFGRRLRLRRSLRLLRGILPRRLRTTVAAILPIFLLLCRLFFLYRCLLRGRGLLCNGLLAVAQTNRIQIPGIFFFPNLLLPLAATGNRRKIRRNRRICLLGLTAAQNSNILVFMPHSRICLLLQTHLHALTHQIHLDDRTAAVGRIHEGLVFGRFAKQILIGVLLILQTAHQSAASAGDLCGIQAEILGLCHLDGNGMEILQKAATAEGSATDAQATYHFCLVTHTDLPQLDTGMEHRSEALDQLAEIHSFIGSKGEKDLAAIKGALRRNQLHIQLHFLDLLQTHLIGAIFLLTIFFCDLFILLSGYADHLTQGCYDLRLMNGMIATGASAVLDTAGGIDNNMLTGLVGLSRRIKVIYLLSGAELNVHHFYSGIHFLLLSYFFHNIFSF